MFCQIVEFNHNTNTEVKEMNKAIQPQYHEAKVQCACGVEFTTGSTQESIKVELCSKCHPFYTGNQRIITTAGGQVDKFKKKYNVEG